MKHSVTETHILAALASRAGGRVEIAPEELDVAVETLIQRDQMLYLETLDASDAVVYDPVQVIKVVLRILPVAEARERMRQQAEALRAYATRQHELQHQRAATPTPRPS